MAARRSRSYTTEKQRMERAIRYYCTRRGETPPSSVAIEKITPLVDAGATEAMADVQQAGSGLLRVFHLFPSPRQLSGFRVKEV